MEHHCPLQASFIPARIPLDADPNIPLQVDKSKIPSMFIKQISKQRPGQQSLCQTGFVSKNMSDSLGSISAVVKKKEDRDTLAEDKLVASDDENSNESETDDEEYECVVCRLEFAGEAKFDQHKRVAQHWGSESMQEGN